jgi:hypothetical protein
MIVIAHWLVRPAKYARSSERFLTMVRTIPFQFHHINDFALNVNRILNAMETLWVKGEILMC